MGAHFWRRPWLEHAPQWIGAVAGAGAVGLQLCCGHLATALASHQLAGNASHSRIVHRNDLRASDRRAWKMASWPRRHAAEPRRGRQPQASGGPLRRSTNPARASGFHATSILQGVEFPRQSWNFQFLGRRHAAEPRRGRQPQASGGPLRRSTNPARASGFHATSILQGVEFPRQSWNFQFLGRAVSTSRKFLLRAPVELYTTVRSRTRST
jgi:hypothetical protein